MRTSSVCVIVAIACVCWFCSGSAKQDSIPSLRRKFDISVSGIRLNTSEGDLSKSYGFSLEYDEENTRKLRSKNRRIFVYVRSGLVWRVVGEDLLIDNHLAGRVGDTRGSTEASIEQRMSLLGLKKRVLSAGDFAWITEFSQSETEKRLRFSLAYDKEGKLRLIDVALQ